MTVQQTSTLTGPALDWAVATCLWIGKVPPFKLTIIKGRVYRVPVTQYAKGGWFDLGWEVCGPIIERENMWLAAARYCAPCVEPPAGREWMAKSSGSNSVAFGNSPLVAAMRCYVASKLGDSVDVPEELI